MKLFTLFFALFFYLSIYSQTSTVLNISEVATMPEPVSNNAVVEGFTNNTPYVYSFGGIDSTKLWSGIHLKSFRYNVATDVWDSIPSLPDTLGKIASGASYVDSIIYIIGGYHVYANHNEASSAKVHRYNPKTNTYLSDGMDIPVAIDDHVQAVWNDSLIYIITGWSNNGNVPNVQIYDPANDNWLVGTPVPNNTTYKVFGASGTIIGNTIFYHGGASDGFNFPGQSTLRIGQINPSNPTQITWSIRTAGFTTYRAVCTESVNYPHWLGGSEVTYNYNGIAYNGSGGVPNKLSNLVWNTSALDTVLTYGNRLPMDLRGIASIDNSLKYIAGGMIANQKVSNKTYKINIGATTSANDLEKKNSFKSYPNPTSSQINLLFDNSEDKTVHLIDVLGNVVLTEQNSSNNIQLNLSNYSKGVYFVKVTASNNSSTQKIIVQ
jgi:hypothetical protein